MSNPVDREATFRATIESYHLVDTPSGSVGVSCKFRIVELWHDGQWWPFDEHDMEIDGDIWIVGTREKGSKVNENGVKTLVESLGWDGLIDSIANETWTPQRCQISVKNETYKNVAKLKVAFVNDWNRTPGGSSVDPAKAKELQMRYGSQLRAIAGNVKRNAPPSPPPGGPPAPTRPTAPAPIAPPPPSGSNSDIPF